MDCREPLEETRSDLPHRHQPGRLQFITWCLGDALPGKALKRLRRERDRWRLSHPEPWTAEDERDYFDRFTHRMDRWLALGRGSCLLREARFADIVEGALMFFEGERTRMDAFVIMPNHVHVLAQILPEVSLSGLMKSWRGVSAREINRARSETGSVWNRDFWDRMIRSPEHYRRVRAYIEDNPKRAGLAPGNYRLWMRERPLWEELKEEGYAVRPAWGPLD